VAYDGGAFRGFADQPGVTTVAGVLREALGRTARMPEPPMLTCAGRTDAGVHARGQVIHVDLPTIPFDGEGLARALNRQVSPAIVVVAAAPVRHSFDARRSAIGRAYRYLVWNAVAPDPLLAPLAWHVRDPLDLRAMNTASDVLLGTHDFRSFCRRPPGTDPENPIVRRVTRATWSIDRGPEALDAGMWQQHGAGPERGLEPGQPRLLRFDITAVSFCHQMVRSLVGSLVEVGRGRANAATLMERLRAASRHQAPDPAPAHGLCLLSVTYGPEPEPEPGTEPGSQPQPDREPV
jgi:tRNA pseudouridine38-40 synthase